MAISKIKGVGKAVKGFGKAMKSQMKKAGVKKPTFPGPRATELLNKEFKKLKGSGPDRVGGPLKMRRDMRTGAQKPGASAIEIDARINREIRRDFDRKLLKNFNPSKIGVKSKK